MNNALKIVSNILMGIAISVFLPAATLAATECKTQLETVLYSASFNTNAPAGKPVSKQMKIIVGKRAKAGGASELIAEISTGTSCTASCRVRNFESESTGAPVALFLDCQDKGFDRLATPATIFWPRHSGEAASLRMGTYVQGFSESRLNVKIDQYSEMMKRVEIAQVSSR